MSQTLPNKFAIAFEWPVVKRALVISAIVGTILILINHGVCILAGKFGMTCMLQSALTYTVPYMVSTISSVLAISQSSAEWLWGNYWADICQ